MPINNDIHTIPVVLADALLVPILARSVDNTKLTCVVLLLSYGDLARSILKHKLTQAMTSKKLPQIVCFCL